MNDLDEIKRLRDEILNNPDKINELTEDQLLSVKKHWQPNGVIIPKEKSYINIAVTNCREEYMQKLLMTSLVGYLFRVAEEFDLEHETEKAREHYNEMSKLVREKNPPDLAERLAFLEQERDEKIKKTNVTARRILREFLNRHFNFSPDHHVRSAHLDSVEGAKETKEERIARVCKVENIEDKLARDPNKTFKYLKSTLCDTHNIIKETERAIGGVFDALEDGDLEEKKAVLYTKAAQLRQISKDVERLVDPISKCETIDALKVNPPVDVFHHWNRYYHNHYEELRDIVSVIYADKPDIEFKIIYFDHFADAETARNYKIQHEKEFACPVSTIENGEMTLLGPFRQNRRVIDTYSKNTEILRQWLQQAEADHKLGKDLMEKRVRNAKAKNIAEAGPDDPGLGEYSKSINVVKDLGAKKVLTKEETEKLSQARAIKEDFEVPDDAIQVDMFFQKDGEEFGDTKLEKAKMYTQSEQPLHMEHDSPYINKYQPNKNVTKKITSKDGTQTKVITKNE